MDWYGNEDDEKTLQRRFQSQGSAGGDPGRSDVSGAGSQAWRASYDDRIVVTPGHRQDGRHLLRGQWMDNVFIERLWPYLEYECAYLHAFETGSELRAGLGRWITYYNTQRPRSGLAGRTPVEAYRRIGQSDHGGMDDNRD